MCVCVSVRGDVGVKARRCRCRMEHGSSETSLRQEGKNALQSEASPDSEAWESCENSLGSHSGGSEERGQKEPSGQPSVSKITTGEDDT